MDFLEDLLGVDHNGAFNFFLSGLKEVTCREPTGQMLYVASILGHYAQTSRYDAEHIAFSGLEEVFCQIVLQNNSTDPEILEIGGSHVLLFAGFFRDQVQARHNVVWYDELGRGFYYRVSCCYSDVKKKYFFEEMSEALPIWTLRCRDLSRHLRDRRYMINV